MREPITKLAIVPITSMDQSIVKQLAPNLREFSLQGGGNTSPVIFFAGRAICKSERNTPERCIVLVSLKHLMLFDGEGKQARAVHVVDMARIVVCQDGFLVIKVPREHDVVLKLEEPLYLDYFINIIKVLSLHFAVGSPLANDVPLERRNSDAAVSGLLVQGAATSHEQLSGGNKVNLTRNGNATYAKNVPIPSILNVDTSKQDFLALLLQVPPPPKRAAADAPLAVQNPNDVARAQAVLRHPLFKPILESRAKHTSDRFAAAAGSSPLPAVGDTQPQVISTQDHVEKNMMTAAPSAVAEDQQAPSSSSAAHGTPLKSANVTVRSIATIERDVDESPGVTPNIIDRSIGGPGAWLRAGSPKQNGAERAVSPPPPPPLSPGQSSPLQKLLLHGTAGPVPAHAPRTSPRPVNPPEEVAPPFPPTISRRTALHDRVEGFMKLYMPHHLNLVDRIASDYEGRDEACIKMLFARLEHEQQQQHPQPDDERAAIFSADEAPSRGHYAAQNASGVSTDEVLRRLQLLEDENRRLRSEMFLKQSPPMYSTPAFDDSRRLPEKQAPRIQHTRAHREDVLGGPPPPPRAPHRSFFDPSVRVPTSLHPSSRAADHDEFPEHDRHEVPPPAYAVPHHGAHRGRRGAEEVAIPLEQFEASIESRPPQERVILRQHRLDELRKEVHELISTDKPDSRRMGQGTMSTVIRIGLLQDEIVAMVAKQRVDVALVDEETTTSQHRRPPTGTMSGFTSRTASEAGDATSRSAMDSQSGNWNASQRTNDPAEYARWYYGEYLPRMVFQQQRHKAPTATSSRR